MSSLLLLQQSIKKFANAANFNTPFMEPFASFFYYTILLVFCIVLTTSTTRTPGATHSASVFVILARTQPLWIPNFRLFIRVGTLLAHRVVRGGHATVAPSAVAVHAVHCLQKVFDAFAFLLDAAQSGAVFPFQLFGGPLTVTIVHLYVTLFQFVRYGVVFGVAFTTIAQFSSCMMTELRKNGKLVSSW